MAQLLALHCIQLPTPFLPHSLPGSGQFLLHQKALLPRRGGQAVPQPSRCNGPPSPHPYVPVGSSHSQLPLPGRNELFLAQEVQMGHQLLLLDTHHHTYARGMPPTHRHLLQISWRLAAPRITCAPPTQNPAAARLPSFFPSPSVFRAQDSSRHLTKGLSSVYLPLDWRSTVPTPPIWKHLPRDAMAHLIIPLLEGLSRLPLVLHAPPPPGMHIPPPQLMPKTYLALKGWPRNALLDDWATLDPAPENYPYQLRLTPHPFMGLEKFVAGRIHQMRAGKRYLTAHRAWWSELRHHACPRCTSAPQTFSHPVLHCPRKNRERSLLLWEVTSLDEGSPLWSSDHLIRALGQFITATHTGFPPEMRLLSPQTSHSLSLPPPPANE